MSYNRKRQNLLNKYPAIHDLMLKAKKRIPEVAWAYLQTGTTHEHLLERNLDAFKDVVLIPSFCKGQLAPKVETSILGQTFSAPFGIAPIGLCGLMWPKIEVLLAQSAARNSIPYCLSTVTTETPETVGPHVGSMGWFQLYPPREMDLCKTILDRASSSGFDTLVITVDIPIPSRRERTKRAGLTTPPKITPKFIWQGLTHPSWTIGTLKRGLPRLRAVEEYSEFRSMMSVEKFVAGQLGGNISWDYCQKIREYWKGPVVIKGLLHPEDAEQAAHLGFDGIVVSNHGARQFDAAPSPLEVLPEIVRLVKGRTTIIMDSGVRSGLDVLRALSLGAEFVLLGRAFIYGVGAIGRYGGDHVYEIIKGDLINNMVNLGIESFSEL